MQNLTIALRLEPFDEYMHELGPEPNFNESMYFNVYDPLRRIGAFFRLGNRPNEGKGEMTICLYLPDGRVGFMFKRPEVLTNSAFDAAGMSFEVIEPFVELKVTYEGSLLILSDPLELADPRAAFAGNPVVPCRAELSYMGCSTMFGGEPDGPRETTGEEFARGHYEQLVEARGTLLVGTQAFEVGGFGLRDHSWGPRYWQAPWYYRWLTANFGAGFGFMGSRIARHDGAGIRSGFVWDGDTLHLCDDFQIATTWEGPDSHHRRVEAELISGTSRWSVEGTVMNLVPLRNRRRDEAGNDLTTRISEGLTEWTLSGGPGPLPDGSKGYGWSEYLDQIVDGRPVGLEE